MKKKYRLLGIIIEALFTTIILAQPLGTDGGSTGIQIFLESKTNILHKEMEETTTQEIVEETMQQTTEDSYQRWREISKDMELRKTIGISKEDFKKMLDNLPYDYAGFYKKNSNAIWEICQELNVNELFVCGIFALESLWGSNSYHIEMHNYGSIMRNDGTMACYKTDEEGIKANVVLLAENYLDPKGKYYTGGTLADIGPIYCPPNPNWADEVYRCMQMILE